MERAHQILRTLQSPEFHKFLTPLYIDDSWHQAL